MTFTNVPVKDLTLELARSGGVLDLVAYVAANGVAAATSTFWVAPHGTYSSTGGTGTSHYDPNGVTPNADLVPTQPAGFSGTFGNGPETAAIAPNLTSMVKASAEGILLLVSNTSGANAMTITPKAGNNPPAYKATNVAKDTATVVPLGKLGLLGPFNSSELSQVDGTFQFAVTGTSPTGFLLAVRVDRRSS